MARVRARALATSLPAISSWCLGSAKAPGLAELSSAELSTGNDAESGFNPPRDPPSAESEISLMSEVRRAAIGAPGGWERPWRGELRFRSRCVPQPAFLFGPCELRQATGVLDSRRQYFDVGLGRPGDRLQQLFQRDGTVVRRYRWQLVGHISILTWLALSPDADPA
jgi:hypothetical protein